MNGPPPQFGLKVRHHEGRHEANPAAVVLEALLQKDLETRLAEALPWVLLTYPDLHWSWLVRHAKLQDAQNRLGFLVALADWLRPHLDSSALEPVLKSWWPSFPGPFLYYPGRRLVPAPLRAFVDFIKSSAASGRLQAPGR